MNMTGRLRTSRAGLELIKSFEGFREAAARLPDGRWTIGYGHVRSAREGVTITEADAEDLLRFDLKPVEDAIHALSFAPLNQNQFDALASLVFNISPGQFKDSEILRSLNAGEYMAAASAFDAWRKARINGRVIVVDALVRRRTMEKAMFLEHPEGRPAAPTPVVTPELDLTTPGLRDAPMGVTTTMNGATATAASSSTAPLPAQNPANDRDATPDVSSAIDRLVRLQSSQQAPATAMEPEAEPSVSTPSANPREASQAVAARIARILDRAEKAADDMAAADAAASVAAGKAAPPVAPPATPPAVPVAPIVLEGLPDFDAEPSAAATRARVLIDDTELYNPGRDPALLFAEAEKVDKVVNGHSKRTATASSRLVYLAPWIVILVLSIVGLGVGMAEIFRNAATEGSAAGASTVLAVFGLLLVMSVYFLWSRSSDFEN